MKLEHHFTVPVPPEQAWEALLDLEGVAPCFPGAQLEEVDGDTFGGRVRVKLGPMTLTYRGQARFVERDAARRRAVIDARGRDPRGTSTAAATVTATLSGDDRASEVHLLTDLELTGRPAQMGGGALKDVSDRLVAQFAERLREQLGGGAAAADGAGRASAPAGDHAPAPTGARTGGGHDAGASAGRAGATDRDDDQLDALRLVLGLPQVRLALAGLAGAIVGMLVGRALGGRRPMVIVVPQENR